MQLKGRREYTEATKGPAKTTLKGSTGHFSLATKNMADIGDSREVRTKDALTSPSLIVCYQEATVLTLTNLVGSNKKSSGLYGGWVLETPHTIYKDKDIPVKESMLKEAQNGSGSALAGNDGLLVVGHRAKVEEIQVLDLLYKAPKVNGEVARAKFKYNLNGFDDLVFINMHIHNTLVNNSAKTGTVTKVLKMFRDAIIRYKARFLVGDGNMAAYKLVPYLRACGIEAHLLDCHVELISATQLAKPSTDKRGPTDPNELLYDSCVIIAIGGLRYRPKTLLPECHMRMGAMVPCLENKNNSRGFPTNHYLTGSEFDFTSAPAELIAEIRQIESNRASHYRKRTHHQERMFSAEEDRETNHTVADPSMQHTANWPLLPDLKGFMARPWLWDPTGRQWSSSAHWPLYVSVGSDRGRTPQANLQRNNKPEARMAIALDRARNDLVEWNTYEVIVAEAMEEKHGPRSDGITWAAYARSKMGQMRAKAEREGNGKAEGKAEGKGGKKAKGQWEEKGKSYKKGWGKNWGREKW